MAERRRHAGAARRLRAHAAADKPDTAREPPAGRVEAFAFATELQGHGQAELRARLGRSERRKHAGAEQLQRRRDSYLDAGALVYVCRVLRADIRRSEPA